MRVVRFSLLIALLAVLFAAAHTITAGQDKVAVCHFTGQPTVIDDPEVPGRTQVFQFGNVIEVADPATVSLAEQGDYIVGVDNDGIYKGAECDIRQKFDGDVMIFCEIDIILSDGSIENIPCLP